MKLLVQAGRQWFIYFHTAQLLILMISMGFVWLSGHHDHFSQARMNTVWCLLAFVEQISPCCSPCLRGAERHTTPPIKRAFLICFLILNIHNNNNNNNKSSIKCFINVVSAVCKKCLLFMFFHFRYLDHLVPPSTANWLIPPGH